MFIKNAPPIARKLLRDNRGAILPIAAILLPVLVLTTGTAVDFSNVFRIKGNMQASIDASVLAVALKAHTLDEGMIEQERELILKNEFKRYYNTNFSSLMFSDERFHLSDGDYTLRFNEDEDEANAAVQYSYNTYFLAVFGMDTIDIGVAGSSVYSVNPENYVIDIVMCIDSTGSMQPTIDAVGAQANSFSRDLRRELGIDQNAEHVKIRVKPIFYRDWMDAPGAPYAEYQEPAVIAHFNSYGHLYEGGLVESDFIDLDPNVSTGHSAASQTTRLSNFLSSEIADGGGLDYPEAAGACLNEGIRADWFDNQSVEAREYFNVPPGHTIIEDGDDIPTGNYSKISTVPVIVFWTDNAISSLSDSRQYLSPSTPTSHNSFEALWNDGGVINQRRKTLIHFGPGAGDGWNNIQTWDRYVFGGTLLQGNQQGVERIAREIKKAIPELLRLSS